MAKLAFGMLRRPGWRSTSGRGKGDKPVSQLRIKHACGQKVEIRRLPPDGPQMPGGVKGY
jgi:hypothetical protein